MPLSFPSFPPLFTRTFYILLLLYALSGALSSLVPRFLIHFHFAISSGKPICPFFVSTFHILTLRLIASVNEVTLSVSCLLVGQMTEKLIRF